MSQQSSDVCEVCGDICVIEQFIIGQALTAPASSVTIAQIMTERNI